MEHMAQNSAMMPTGDILSLGHYSEGCLPSPKRRDLGTLGTCPSARPGGRAGGCVLGGSVLFLWAPFLLDCHFHWALLAPFS